MDILISSNLERLLYHMSGESDAAVRGWMTQLAENGKYTVEPEVMAKIQNEFAAGYCDEAAVADTIHKTYTDQKLPVRHPHRRGCKGVPGLCSPDRRRSAYGD